MVISVRLEQSKNPCNGISVSLLLSLTVTSFVHPLNILSPRDVTVSGIIMDSKLVQSIKVYPDNVVTASGMFIDTSLLHPRKALPFIKRTVPGMITFVILVLFLKALLSMPITIYPSTY